MGVTVTPSFAQLRNKPTTMTGYGITDEKCKAWVNFNGTGTVAIRASANVSSITDNGTGNYTVNFTTAMSDANYCVQSQGEGANSNGNPPYMAGYYPLTSASSAQFTFETYNSVSFVDPVYACVAIFR